MADKKQHPINSDPLLILNLVAAQVQEKKRFDGNGLLRCSKGRDVDDFWRIRGMRWSEMHKIAPMCGLRAVVFSVAISGETKDCKLTRQAWQTSSGE